MFVSNLKTNFIWNSLSNIVKLIWYFVNAAFEINTWKKKPLPGTLLSASCSEYHAYCRQYKCTNLLITCMHVVIEIHPNINASTAQTPLQRFSFYIHIFYCVVCTCSVCTFLNIRAHVVCEAKKKKGKTNVIEEALCELWDICWLNAALFVSSKSQIHTKSSSYFIFIPIFI